MDKQCSPEEIERKRLLALQRRQQAQLKAQITPTTSPARQQLNDSQGVARQNKSNNRFNPIEPRTCFSPKSTTTGKCYMISNDRFALEVTSFVPAIIETFKTMPSRSYDMKSRTWSFHINDYDDLLNKLAMSNDFTIAVTKIPDDVLQIFKKNSMSNNQIPDQDLSKIDETLTDTLMPFQRDGICYGISKNGRCMIADDMGLGKTIQALGIAHYYKDSWPLLIVAPSSVKFHWSDAIHKFLPSVPIHYIHHFKNSKDSIEDDKITIISYDLLGRAIKVIARHTYGFIILDESHALKSDKTVRFQAAREMCSYARHVVLLTGTPALSRPIELYSQISLIMRHFMSEGEYGLRYCAGRMTEFGWDFTGSSNMQELQLLLKNNCMIRRLKTEVLNQLPSKTRQMIILDPNLVKDGTKKMMHRLQLFQKTVTASEKNNALIDYYTESSYARLTAVGHYVTNLFESKRKCILYAHHKVVMDAICDIAEDMNIQYIRIDGKTNPEKRKNQIDTFQECSNCLVAILSITAANSGITLTAATLVVFAELYWNPGILCQAENRVHRIGQNDNVVIQYLVAKKTADDFIWPLLKQKLQVLNTVGLEQEFSIDNIEVVLHKAKPQNLISFFNISSGFETDSQSQHNKEDEEEASTSDDFKELLEVDEECFDSCDWDDDVIVC